MKFQAIQAVYCLNAKNYLNWLQLLRMILKEKWKISHILGTGSKLGDPQFDVYDEEDSMIMTWLWDSISPKISNTCMFLSLLRKFGKLLKKLISK